MKRFAPFFGLLGATVCLWSSVASASDARTILVRDAVVNGKSIYLSDLLPESSPSAVRIPAEEILIGRSPQPGSIRVLSGSEIVRRLDGGNLLGRVDVPEKIVVHRSGHLITRQEVAEAIRRVLSRNEAFRTVQIDPNEIRLTARVTILAENPDLRVTRIEPDPTLHQMKFWLVSRAEPTLLPFIAMARATCDTCDSTGSARAASTRGNVLPNIRMRASMNEEMNHSGPDFDGKANPAPVLAPIFVELGKMVRLHLISGTTMQIYLTAMPLERGTLGQTVRVKIKSTGRILSAHVVGRDQLEAEF